jgi:hypothetical protein
MHGDLEGHEAHEHAGEPWTLPVAVTMSILTVLVAMATLLAHRAATDKLLVQTKATDQWAYYQAKNIRLHEMQVAVDLLGSLAPADKEKAAATREKYAKQVERYQDDKDEISDKAKELESEGAHLSRREDRFDLAEVILEIGLIICSLTLITRKMPFWYAGIALGVVGFLVALTGLFVH